MGILRIGISEYIKDKIVSLHHFCITQKLEAEMH